MLPAQEFLGPNTYFLHEPVAFTRTPPAGYSQLYAAVTPMFEHEIVGVKS